MCVCVFVSKNLALPFKWSFARNLQMDLAKTLACELLPPPKKKECFSCPSVWYQPTMSYYKNI